LWGKATWQSTRDRGYNFGGELFIIIRMLANVLLGFLLPVKL